MNYFCTKVKLLKVFPGLFPKYNIVGLVISK